MRARVVVVVVSWVLVAVGVSLLVRAEVGVAPYDVLNTGIADIAGIGVGTAFLIDALVLYVVGWLLGGRLGWASVAGTFVISPIIEVLLDVLPETARLAARIPLFGVGLAILCVAVCLAIVTDLGAGPTEVLMLGLVARRVPVAAARWVTDGLVLVIGTLLGGAVGVGTVVFLVAFGPMVAAVLQALGYTPPGAAPIAPEAVTAP